MCNSFGRDARWRLALIVPARKIWTGYRTAVGAQDKINDIECLSWSLAHVRFKLAEYVEAAAKIVPSLASKYVTPHSFRHATVAHLVAAGVDITVIRSWLGHVSLDTTSHYAQANLDTKRQALERLENSIRPGKPPSWKHDKSVLAWLDTL